MTASTLDPGSPEAIAQGCTCDPQCDPGATITPDGRVGYICDWRCPLHGIELFRRSRHGDETGPPREPAKDATEPIKD